MQKLNKFFSLLSLCQKAGKLCSGELTCENALKGKKAKLLIVAQDASDNTVKKFTNSAQFYGCEIIRTGTKENLGSSIGRDMRSVMAVTDEGFAKQLKILSEQLSEN